MSSQNWFLEEQLGVGSQLTFFTKRNKTTKFVGRVANFSGSKNKNKGWFFPQDNHERLWFGPFETKEQAKEECIKFHQLT